MEVVDKIVAAVREEADNPLELMTITVKEYPKNRWLLTYSEWLEENVCLTPTKTLPR